MYFPDIYYYCLKQNPSQSGPMMKCLLWFPPGYSNQIACPVNALSDSPHATKFTSEMRLISHACKIGLAYHTRLFQIKTAAIRSQHFPLVTIALLCYAVYANTVSGLK